MTTFLSYLRLLFFSVSGMLLLCTVFTINSEFVNGMVTGKVSWFHTVMLFFAGSTLFMECTVKTKNNIKLLLPDGLILLYAAIVLITYDWKLNPEPQKLLFGGQLVLLWFMLRLAIKKYKSLVMFYVSIIICISIFEAYWGIMQLYGLSSSGHPLFRFTGSFFNPGPFSGYLATLLPISLGVMLRFKNCKKTLFWEAETTLYYLALISIISIISILPAGMSRSAWIAAAVSCIWVYISYQIGWSNLFALAKKHRVKSIGILVAVLIISGIGLAAIYAMKKDSADGRLQMWNITAKAITEQPIKGVGLGGFPATFAQTQAAYFASGKATETEKLVAGCPEYAFNEFLQIGLEQGIPGLIVFTAWIVCSLYYGIKSKRYAMTGGIISLMIFAFSSYPLQLPSFWILLIFLSAICVTTNKISRTRRPGKKLKFPYIGIITTIGCLLLYLSQKEMPAAYSQWSKARAIYNGNGYSVAVTNYAALYPHLSHDPGFLFEYSQCLSKTGEYEQANILLDRAVKLSSDPMNYYMMAKNKQTLKEYEQAEKHLLYAITILPERIYPYYLLVKLYSEPDFYQPEKLKNAAWVVINKQPKVENSAVKEMRNEARKLLSSMNQ